MPKYAGRRRPTTYKRRSTRGSTVKKPYGGSKYGNDAFIKVEYINNLAVTPSTGTPALQGEIYSIMRVD